MTVTPVQYNEERRISLSRGSLPLSWLTFPLPGSWLEGGLCVACRGSRVQFRHNESSPVVRMARGPGDRRDWEPCGSPPDLGAGGQHSICVQGPEMLSDDTVPHGTGKQSSKHQAGAQPGGLSLEEEAWHSRKQPLAQLSHRPKRGFQLWPKRGE